MTIVIVDTTVFLNLLDVPRFNQNREAVLGEFKTLLATDPDLLLPLVVIVEAGNHIGQLPDGRQRRRYAQKFADQVRLAIEGGAPWTPTPLPSSTDLASALAEFPNDAARGLGVGDHLIQSEWRRQCAQHTGRRVRVWSLDAHLQGLDSHP